MIPRWVLVLVVLMGLCTGLGIRQVSDTVSAQTVAIVPAPQYYIEFVQPANSPAGNPSQRVMLYGPEPSLALCLASLQIIMGAPAGVGSMAWSWQPAVICYHVP